MLGTAYAACSTDVLRRHVLIWGGGWMIVHNGGEERSEALTTIVIFLSLSHLFFSRNYGKIGR